MKKIIGLLLIISLINCTRQPSVKFELPSIIGSGMVLQRNTDAVLWGHNSPGQKIYITTSWGVKKAIRTDKSGNWHVKIQTDDAGGPFEVAFHTKDTSLVLQDVLIGEVWLCSGQSNMEMPLTGWPPTDTINNSVNEISNANYPLIRFFTVARNTATNPLDSCNGIWLACSPETVASFSATAYFFGIDVHQKLGLPVGLIHSSWGGTPAEAWTSKEYLADFPAYKGIVDSFKYAEAEYDSLIAWLNQRKTLTIKWNDPGFIGSLNQYTDQSLSVPAYDDPNWLVTQVPSTWESNVLPDFDGIVWLRTSFNVPAAFTNKELILHLGPIDDMDETFINATRVGATLELGKWKENRDYVVPVGTVKVGQNLLAVKVIDNTGGGGIYGTDDITLTDKSGKAIVLSGEWRCMPVAEILGSKIHFYDWENNYLTRPSVKRMIGPYTPTTLYNAMVSPLVPFTIKGAIWYQGEANVGRGFEYRSLFPAMIACWRAAWKQGDFPFYYVQIAPWEYGDTVPSSSAEVREAQLMALSVPNTGMAVTMDIGNPTNIHPSNKQEVGRRLALWALAKDYGFDTLSYCGPLYDTISAEGGKIVVHFNFTDGGLLATGSSLTYFEIAGNDQVYYPADAVIINNTVEVSSSQVPEPVAVRYGWRSTAELNLFNGAGLPASPFRSDNWKRLSE